MHSKLNERMPAVTGKSRQAGVVRDHFWLACVVMTVNKLLGLILISACGGRSAPSPAPPAYAATLWSTADRPCAPSAVAGLCVKVTRSDGAAIRAALVEALAEDRPDVIEVEARALIARPSDSWTFATFRIYAIETPASGELVELTALFSPSPSALIGFQAVLARTEAGWRVSEIRPYHEGIPQPN